MKMMEPPPSNPLLPDESGEKSNTVHVLDQEDGFQISPFSSPSITLQLRGDQRLTIHRDVLLRSAEFSRLCDPSTTSLDLGQTSGRAGHILVQYLYTSKYEALKWMGSPRPDADLNDFKVAVEVYAMAREYELDGLEELAKEQIQSDGRLLNAFTIMDAIREAYPSPAPADLWFPEYIKSKMKAAFEGPTTLLSSMVKIDFGDSMSVAKMVLRGMLEVYCEMLQSLAPRPAEDARVPRASARLTPSFQAALQSAPESTDQVAQVLAQSSPSASPSGKAGDDAEADIVPVELVVDSCCEETKVNSDAALDICSSSPAIMSHDTDQGIGDPSTKPCDDSPIAVPENPPDAVSPEPGPPAVSLAQAETALEAAPAYPEGPLDLESELDPGRPSVPSDFDPDNQAPVGHSSSTSEKDATTSGGTTALLSKDSDEFWAALMKRRKARRERRRSGTVTFEVPDNEPANDLRPGELTKKGKQLSGTAPEFVPGSHIRHMTGVEALGDEISSSPPEDNVPLPVEHRSTPAEPGASHGVKAPFRQDPAMKPVFSPSSDPEINDVPDLVPPDPKIWGPIGSHLNKSRSSQGLSDKSTASAKPDREIDLTPEPTTPSEKWESWGQFFAIARSRKRALSMSTSLTTLPMLQSDADAGSKAKSSPDLWSVVPLKKPFEPVVIDDSHGGARATPDPEPEPEAGAVLVQGDDNTPSWNQSDQSPPAESHHRDHPIPRKKRSKRSRRLRALAEEQGMALAESVAQGEGEAVGSDVLSQSTADERDQLNVEISSRGHKGGGLRVQTPQPSEGDTEKHGEGQEQDPWEFWGAKRSPT